MKQNLLDYDANIKVSNYMQIQFNISDSPSTKGRAFSAAQKWPLPPAGCVAAIALDGEGNELGRTILEVSTSDVKDKAAAFVEAHLPPAVDARQKWDEAFALAKKTNRRVWVRISQRYCAPCHLLNRWLDDHRELLDKEFVMLKIDDVRDLHGLEIAKEITGGQSYSVPFFGFYNGDEKMLVNSVGPIGNIGFMSGYESKRHLRRMLEQGKRRLTGEEVEQLLNSLND